MIEPAAIKSVRVRQAYEYWLRKAAGGRLPSRNDIKPRELVGVLDQIFLVDVTQRPLTFHFRLFGSALTKWAGKEYTGFSFNANGDSNWRTTFNDYRSVVESHVPRCDERSAPWASKDFYTIERMVAPLSADGRTVEMLFGALQVI
jgi:hypothetical protein